MDNEYECNYELKKDTFKNFYNKWKIIQMYITNTFTFRKNEKSKASSVQSNQDYIKSHLK